MTEHKATPHRAKPEVWARVESYGNKDEKDMLNCILELRDRVEALEAAAKPVESNDPAPSHSLIEPPNLKLMTNNQTDWQELCAQLFEALRAHGTTWSDDVLLDRVWVALRAAESRAKRKLPTQAEPERKLPTREEAAALYTEVMIANDCQTLGDMAETFSHAVLARWGK